MHISELLRFRVPVVLASASPRRHQLLRQIGLDFTIRVSEVVEEEVPARSAPVDYVQDLALAKAQDIAAVLPEEALVIGADTVVVYKEVILGKPAGERDAVRMLTLLSGQLHQVYTGIALVNSAAGRSHCAVQQTEVQFRVLEPKEIEAYVATGSPLDKAGAYGIQDDFGAVFVREIKGCYYNVVGLPLELLYRSMRVFCDE